MSNPLSNCCQSMYTTPITREKLFIIGGGILGTILVVGILVAIFSGGEDGNGHKINGSDVLKYVPLIVGQNDLATNIKKLSKNHLDQFDFNNYDKSKASGWSTCKVCKTDLTHLKNGMVGSQVWSLRSDCPSAYKDAVSITLEEIDVMRRLITKYSDNITFVQDSKGLEGSFANGKLTGSIAVKGGHTIDGRLGVLRSYYDLGVRFLSLSDGCEDAVKPVFPSPPWYSDATGLNDFGKKVVGELNRLGIVIDLSKLSKPVQLSVLAATTSPAIVYGNALTKCSDKNNVDDEVLAKLKDNGGVILVSFDPTLVVGNEKKQDAKLSDLLTHIIYLKEKIGAEHIGIGGGFDGFEGEIKDLENPSKIPVLFDVLFNNTDEKVRWSTKELEGLAGNNLLKVLQKVEANAAEQQKKISPCEDYDVKDDYKNATCYSDFDIRF